MPCHERFGCHECSNRLLMLHSAIRQELAEKLINHDKIRAELLSIKRFIEDIVGVEQPTEDSNGSVN